MTRPTTQWISDVGEIHLYISVSYQVTGLQNYSPVVSVAVLVAVP